MLDGVNDSETQAKALAKLLKNISAKVNLIPFNPFPNTQYKTSNRYNREVSGYLIQQWDQNNDQKNQG